MREYKECYIAFLDLLGFKNLIKNNTDNKGCEFIASCFDEINTEIIITHDVTHQPLFDHNELHMKVMSDSICFYIDSTVKNALAGIIAICTYFQVRLLRLTFPILVRGAIVKGDIYADADVIFGPGLTKAYLLEENVAKYPRVIITKSTIDNSKECDNEGKEQIDIHVFKDNDAFYALDYLYLFYGLNHEKDVWKKFAKYIYYVLDTEHDPSIREKYLYIEHSLKRITKRYLDDTEEQQPCPTNQQQ